MKQIRISSVFTLFCIVVVVALSTDPHFKLRATSRIRRKLFEWGHTFGGSGAKSENLQYDCTHNGQPICCDLLKDDDRSPPVAPRDISVTVPACTHGCICSHSL